MTDTVRLGDTFDVDIHGDDHGGKVYQLQINGSIRDPDSVTVTLHNGVSFEIPWGQYER
jgi:hypothetical protein